MMLGFFVFQALVKLMNELIRQLMVAFCLMLIIEGFLPFLYPQKWRKLVLQMAQISNRQMRYLGLASMLLGLVLLQLVR